jgi:enoyl-CoA hydratase/carnithine racemase
MDAELVGALASVLDDVEHRGIENLVFQFGGGPDSVTGDFPAFRPGPARNEIRYFAHWEETLFRVSRLKAKTFAAFDGRVGAAGVYFGLVMDLRLATAQARLSLGSLADGHFPGMGAYWLPKFVGLGNARKFFLVGDDLSAKRASKLGLVDVVRDTMDSAVDATLTATSAITPEAACFMRRILDECYVMERSAGAELVKAARFKLRMPEPQSVDATVGVRIDRRSL